MFPNLSHNQMWHSIWNYLTLSNDLLKCEAETQYTICKFAKVQNIFCHEKFKTVTFFFSLILWLGYGKERISRELRCDIDTFPSDFKIFLAHPVPAFDQFDIWLDFLVLFFVFFVRFCFPFLVCPFPCFFDPLALFRSFFLIFLILLQIFFTSPIDLASSLQHLFNFFSVGKFSGPGCLCFKIYVELVYKGSL